MRVVTIAGTVLLLAALAACGQVAPYDNGVDPRLLTIGPTRSPSPAPAEPVPGRCPAPGLSVAAGQVDAALGHRASVLTATNCGVAPLVLDGYPAVRLLDGVRAPLAVTVVHGMSYMARDPGPARFTLAPGEQALSVLSWSNTVTDGDPAAGEYAEVVAVPGAEAQALPLDTDLGTTGQLTVTAWARTLLN
ncbi:hypothetical protein FHX82_004793 [Amycolatopsis bartoniae]|nr:DUF4232 domain-containing protein [Amycolatopsis bartoniae]MBB2937717.1 hypothetical protein [Amycolatopsis bartoniae]TVT08199.1 DUF4232 domain-containing protein [Amycolatopsis bartoniae]